MRFLTVSIVQLAAQIHNICVSYLRSCFTATLLLPFAICVDGPAASSSSDESVRSTVSIYGPDRFRGRLAFSAFRLSFLARFFSFLAFFASAAAFFSASCVYRISAVIPDLPGIGSGRTAMNIWNIWNIESWPIGGGASESDDEDEDDDELLRERARG